MKKIILLCTVVLLCTVSVHAAEVKLGYVDLNKALNESEEGKKAVKTLEELFKSKQAVIEDKRKELGKLNEELQKQSSILTQDAIKEKQEERDRLGRDFQRIVKDSEEEVEKKRADFMDRILKDLAEIIRKTGEEEGYTAIFEKAQGGIMFIQEKLDLTDKIIKKYNEASKAAGTKK
ncbi:MAG: OmpH family outer membrane protein [Nitrospiraceae bacterium]|nr:MAG: OmpH family outer membrane protein [Nitrospiraceae bacterium]